MERKFTICNLQFAICNLFLVLATAATAAPSPPSPGAALPKTASWHPPRVEEVKAQAIAWLEKAHADGAARAKAAALWGTVPEQASGTDLLERLAETFALANTDAAKLVQLCAKPRGQLVPPSQPWLTDPKTLPLAANNMRLYYARWLVQGNLFDEALELIAALKPGDVAAPAELLFYQGVVYHRLLNKDEGLKAIDQLLDGAEGSPLRYVAVARLMQSDLGGIEPDTLGHIARRMEDIERRLDLGRAGPKVRKIEDGVIESLDKLIKKIEEEQQKQQMAGQAGGTRSSAPAQRSTLPPAQGAGDVTKKNIGSRSGWGDLPAKEREEALQQIGREFPAHYRDLVEQYFRRLATEENKQEK